MIYEYKCNDCDAVHERVLKIKNFTTTAKCPHCDGVAEKIISLTARVDSSVFEEYYDKIQGRSFKTRRDFESYCKEKNLYRPTQDKIDRHRSEFEPGQKGDQ